MSLIDEISDETDGVVELIVDSVTDSEVVWREYDATTPKENLNTDLPQLSEGDLVQFDTVTGKFTLLG